MKTGSPLGDIFGEYVETASVEVFVDSPSPRKKKKKTYRQFHRNTNVRASKLDMAVSACESHQRGLGFNVVSSGWVGGRKYKVVTRNYAACIEEIFWFHVY